METLLLIGRVMFSLIFLGSGMGHLLQADESAETAAEAGLPNAKLMVQLSGVGLLAGGIGIATGIWIDIALLAMFVLTLIMAFAMHSFWKMQAADQQMHMAHFMKNICIAGAALFMFTVYAYNGGFDVANVIVGPLLELTP